MSDKKYWVNPNGRACSFLKKYDPSKSASNGKKPVDTSVDTNSKHRNPVNEAVTVINDPEVISGSKKRDALVPHADANHLPNVPDVPRVPKAVFSPPLDLAEFEKTIRKMAATLDFDLPEGLLDRWFLRSRNYRVEEKTERVRLIGEFEAAVTNLVSRQCDVAEEVRRHNQIRYQQLFDALDTWNTANEKHRQIFLATERAKDDRAIEIERTRIEIEKNRGRVSQNPTRAKCRRRGSQGSDRQGRIPRQTSRTTTAAASTRAAGSRGRSNTAESEANSKA